MIRKGKIKEAETRGILVVLLVTFIAVLSWFFTGFAILNFLVGLIGILIMSFTNILSVNTETYIKVIYSIIAAAASMKTSDWLEKLAEKLLNLNVE